MASRFDAAPHKATLAARHPAGTAYNWGRKKQTAAERIAVRRGVRTGEICAVTIGAPTAVEDQSWKVNRGVGIFTAGRRLEFFTAVGCGLSAVDSLDIWVMRPDDQLIAYRSQPRFRDAVLDYNFARRVQYEALSPAVGSCSTTSFKPRLRTTSPA